MAWLSPREKRERNRRALRWALGAVVLVAAVSLIDTRAYSVFRAGDAVVEREWYKALRSVGYLPAWMVLGLGAVLVLGPAARGARAAAMLVLSPALAGSVAEVLKLVIGRERPTASGAHVWRGLFSGFDNGSGLGLPSSHAAVAFGGAFALAVVWPRLRTLGVALACGCGLTRMLTGDHFLSDVVGGGLIGWGSASVVRSLVDERAVGIASESRW